MLDRLATTPRVTIAVIAFLIVLSIPLQIKIDSMRDESRLIERTLYFDSSTLKKLSLGYEELLSDIYWLRAIQYFGSSDIPWEKKDPEILFRYFDIITDLDPKFVNAYRFGGTFLAEPFPLGLDSFELGIKLLDKGRKNNPDNFRIPLEEAFLYYIYAKDYKRAAELFKEASEKPGLSDLRRASIAGMAAASLSKKGDLKLAREIWKLIYETSDNEGRRKFALQNIWEIDTRLLERKLTRALRKYVKDKGRFPRDVSELILKGYTAPLPKGYNIGDFVIAKRIYTVRNKKLAKRELNENARLYTAKAQRFKKIYGRYPKDFSELRDFIVSTSTFVDYDPHPLGGDYLYDPKTGKVFYRTDVF